MMPLSNITKNTRILKRKNATQIKINKIQCQIVDNFFAMLLPLLLLLNECQDLLNLKINVTLSQMMMIFAEKKNIAYKLYTHIIGENF